MFRLEEPKIERKEEALKYINEFIKYNSRINGVGGLDRYLDDYEEWLKKLDKDFNSPEEGRVKAKTFFLVREEDNKIVGMINIRLDNTDFIIERAGHIGYSIRPTERRKGYNKINLYLGLEVLAKYNFEKAYLFCMKGNLGSSKTMEALGGKMVKEFYDEDHDEILQKYEIDINDSLEKYKTLIKK